MKRVIVLALASVLSMSVLTGCIRKVDASSPGTEAKTEAEEDVLNVYTALEDERVADYITQFKEQNPDVTVNITRESTGIITSKLLAEKDNLIADVVWGLSATSLLVLGQNDMLDAYGPEGADRILPEFKDDAEVPTWVGIDAWETAFIVNKEVLQSKGIDTVPQSYEDLLDPQYKGLIVMSNPASSGTGLLVVNGILSLYGEKEGWDYMDRLHDNVAAYMHSGSQPAKATAAGEYGIGISFGYRCIQSADEVGGGICDTVFPTEGSGWDMEANALVKKDNVKEISKTFLDWAITENVMDKYAKHYPIIATGVGDHIPQGYSQNPMDQLIPDMDFNEAASNRDSVLKDWTKRYDSKSEEE